MQLLSVSVLVLLTFTLPSPWNRLSSVGYLLLGSVMVKSLTPVRTHASEGAWPGRLYGAFGLVTLITAVIWYLTPLSLRNSGVPLLALWAVFSFWSARRLIGALSQERTINGAVLRGAFAGYLMLGLSGGLICCALETTSPGQFSNVELAGLPSAMEQPVWGLNFIRLNYFAFVTLTTTGYGEVTPLTPIAQILSVAIAMAGTFYLAVVMGLMISRFTQGNQN